uniref:hypothetical protein n=1 Tax=Barnesiella intestinihominis TaxID=487174 RepID=UPI003966F997
ISEESEGACTDTLFETLPFCTIFGKIFKENEKSQPLWLTFNDMCFDLNLNFQRKIPYSHQDILCFG